MTPLAIFDIRTLLFLGGVTALAGALALEFSRHVHLASREGLQLFSMAMGLVAAGLLLASSPGNLTAWLTLLAAGSTLLNVASIVAYEATRRLFSRRPRTRPLLLAIAVVVAVNAWIVYQGDSVEHHVLFGCLVQTLTAAAMGWTALRSRDRAAGRARVVFVAICALFALANAARLLRLLSVGLTIDERGLPINTWAQVGAAMVNVVVPLLLWVLVLAIVNSRLATDLRRWATTDELTGLPLRRSLLEHAPTIIRTAQARGATCAVLMLDLDKFKSVNDRFGHAVGDHVLRHCASILQHTLRPDAIIARYGGEEFCAVVPINRIDDAFLIADRMRQSVEAAPFEDRQLTIPMTISIGVTVNRSGLLIEELLKEADQGVYLAKARGRNQVVLAGDPSPDETT